MQDIYHLTKTELETLIGLAVSKAVSKINPQESKRKPQESKRKSQDQKRKPSPVIAEQKKVYDELRSEYRRINLIDDSVSDESIRKQVKEGVLPYYPRYSDALVEYSRRRSEADPEHARKAKARVDNMMKERAEKAKTKSQSSSETSSVISEPAPKKKVLKVAKAKTQPSEPSIDTSEPKKKRVAKKIPEYEITEVNQTDDPQEFNRILKINNQTYAMNSLNHVATVDAEWVGIWDGEKIVECEQPDEE